MGKVANEINKLYGKNPIIYRGDIQVQEDFKNIVNKVIQKWNKVDFLVNNAGITKDNLIIRMTDSDWEEVLNVNLKGTFNGMKCVLKHMIKNKFGKIINISSVVGISGNAGQSNYSASKAGIVGLTKSVVKELGSRNININVIAPGYIETSMTKKLNDTVKNNLLNSIPLKRLGKKEDIANLACFLLSEKSNYITGQVICVDGGMTI